MAPRRMFRTAVVSNAFVIGASVAAVHADDAGAPSALDELDPSSEIAERVIDLARWVVSSSDNAGLPFAVIDKDAAQILVFAGDGKVRGAAPALLGSAVGDDSAPGVAERALRDIPAKDRTTPAGRFVAAYGPAVGGETVLWIDHDTAVSIHPLPPKETSERRADRLASPEPDDNRITHGCINVSETFYAQVVKPVFGKGGLFYVLPDTKPLDETFPDFAAAHDDASA